MPERLHERLLRHDLHCLRKPHKARKHSKHLLKRRQHCQAHKTRRKRLRKRRAGEGGGAEGNFVAVARGVI